MSGRLWEHLALGSAAFWVLATASVFLFGLEGALWVVLVYSAYANVGTDLSRWQAARAERVGRNGAGGCVWEYLALASAIFWVLATVAVFLHGLHGDVWVVVLYSAYANVGTDLSRWQAARAERVGRENRS